VAKAKAPDWNKLIYTFAAAVLAALASAVTYWLMPEKERKVEVEKIVFRDAAGIDYAETFGWERDPAVIAQNLDPERTLQFAQTPAGKAAQGDGDVFLWRAVRKAAGKANDWYPNIDQGSVGSCVGAGFKHGSDVAQATAMLAGAAFDWKPVSAEVIYGGSRVEVGGGRISGDGSVGAWAAKWVKEHGLVPMEKFDGGIDLTQYSPARARQYGRSGVPDGLEPEARNHLVKGVALVRSATDVKRAILQGYPVPICSDQGFTMERDADGAARPRGTWMHCMCVLGYRADKNMFFVLNSWGDRAHTGPVWPEDMPRAGFWCDWDTMDRIARQGDSFALADVQGFPARNPPLDWFIRAEPAPRPLDNLRLARKPAPAADRSLAW